MAQFEFWIKWTGIRFQAASSFLEKHIIYTIYFSNSNLGVLVGTIFTGKTREVKIACLSNFKEISFDPSNFKNQNSFDPNNFLDSNGNFVSSER